MNCPRCAAGNLDGASLCARCGSPLPLVATATAAGEPMPPPPPPPGTYPQPGYYPPPQGYGQPGYPPPGYPGAYGYPPPYGMYPQPPRTSGMAIAGFVMSLVFCGVLGLIFSIMGNNEVKRSNGTVTGGGLALAGIIISIVRIVCEIIYIVVIIAAVSGNAHVG